MKIPFGPCSSAQRKNLRFPGRFKTHSCLATGNRVADFCNVASVVGSKSAAVAADGGDALQVVVVDIVVAAAAAAARTTVIAISSCAAYRSVSSSI